LTGHRRLSLAMTIDPRQATGAPPQISGELIRHDERPSSGTLNLGLCVSVPRARATPGGTGTDK
jgi:hypothetical protein